ncbi:MAG: GNAT family N-acetyltransferase [Candidatus Thermoplasmatota archaeon]|nr:GNAT family N-acetyltransferase [Candidatus Thermoplasmatota archaeon]
MNDVEVIEINKENIDVYPPRCFLKKDNPGQIQKNQWVLNRLDEGMKIKLVLTKKDKKLIGYIEYIPSEYAWRAVDAKDLMFIHCIWVSPKKNREQGLGSLLINECITDSKKLGLSGVAVVTSSDSFMVDKEVFMKNDFNVVEEPRPYSLLVKHFKKNTDPFFLDWKAQLKKYEGFHIVYSCQCPWVARFMNEMKHRFKELDLTVTELKTAKDAQHAPSIYATFNLIHDGDLLADHYISERRFENIVKKEQLG